MTMTVNALAAAFLYGVAYTFGGLTIFTLWLMLMAKLTGRRFLPLGRRIEKTPGPLDEAGSQAYRERPYVS